MEEYEIKLIKNIEEHGWQFTFVFDPEGEKPDFGYSIGFEKNLGHPEFIIFGLPKKLMHSMLWEVFRAIKAGKVPSDGVIWQNLLDGDYNCVSRLITNQNCGPDYFNSAMWFYKFNGGDVSQQKFYQMVWPGVHDKLYPWDTGCSESVIEAQPSLYI